MISPAENLGGEVPARRRQHAALDTANHFMVGSQDGMLVILNPPVGRKFNKSEAINLAAWLVALADPDEKEFERVLKEIKKT